MAGEIGRDGRFIAYDNGTVLDTETGLMWAPEITEKILIGRVPGPTARTTGEVGIRTGGCLSRMSCMQFVNRLTRSIPGL